MQEIVVKGRRADLWFFLLLSLGFAGFNFWEWSQGKLGVTTKVLTVVPCVFSLLLIVPLCSPPFLRWSDGTLQVKLMPGLLCSTPSRNVAELDRAGAMVRIRFFYLSQVERSANMKGMLEATAKRGGFHVEVSMKVPAEELQRLREKVFEGRAA